MAAAEGSIDRSIHGWVTVCASLSPRFFCSCVTCTLFVCARVRLTVPLHTASALKYHMISSSIRAIYMDYMIDRSIKQGTVGFRFREDWHDSVFRKSVESLEILLVLQYQAKKTTVSVTSQDTGTVLGVVELEI